MDTIMAHQPPYAVCTALRRLPWVTREFQSRFRVEPDD
jgi:hypothetical protein